ncbi:hypothetical protein G5G57_001638 [Escherichia coli]|nr:hypothetical protein [Escherichia coli]EEY2486638.1 hypothetical protein [Escherichia coli]EFF3875038.1 hypothetical protein [Escherichia coli]EFF3885455.1 hypothetical protein [Escherichia coli]EFJ2962196.1 hypothetical protein [Escherichia coli]
MADIIDSASEIEELQRNTAIKMRRHAWLFRVVGLVRVARRRSNLRTNNRDCDGLKAANFNIVQLRCKNVQNHFS